MTKKKARQAKIVALCMQKGGVGKTTSTLNIGAGLSLLKKKVLLVDLDYQGHLTLGLLGKDGEPGQSIFEAMIGDITATTAIQEIGGLSLIPSSELLAAADIELQKRPSPLLLLKEVLSSLKGHYDYVLIDTGPQLGTLFYNALIAADITLIPFEVEYYATSGLGRILRTIEAIKEEYNPSLDVRIFANKYRKRRRITKEIWEELEEALGKQLLKTTIPDNVSLAEAPANQMDIFTYKKNSIGAKAYMELCKEIVKLNRRKGKK